MNRWRSVGKKLVLLLLGLGLGTVAAEVCLWLVGVSYPLPYVPDPVCGTRLQPGFAGWWQKEGRAYIRINRFGFRHGDREPQKPPGTFRVAVLGDSFIEAFQVPDEQTFCAVLERELGRCESLRGRRVEVLNFGVSGYGTAQELLMLREYVWPYEPDVVLLAFFAGNDVRNNSAELESSQARPFFRRRGAELVLDQSFLQHPDYRKAQSAWVRGKVALIQRLRILQLAMQVRENWRSRQASPGAGSDPSRGIDAAALRTPSDASWEAAWAVTERLVAEIAAESARHRARFLALSIGCDFQVHPEAAQHAAALARLGLTESDYAGDRLADLGRGCGFEVLQLVGPLQRSAVQQHTFLHGFPNTPPGVGHWNAAGHRLAAEITAAALCPDTPALP